MRASGKLVSSSVHLGVLNDKFLFWQRGERENGKAGKGKSGNGKVGKGGTGKTEERQSGTIEVKGKMSWEHERGSAQRTTETRQSELGCRVGWSDLF